MQTLPGRGDSADDKGWLVQVQGHLRKGKERFFFSGWGFFFLHRGVSLALSMDCVGAFTASA